jgi:hypothetical protein
MLGHDGSFAMTSDSPGRSVPRHRPARSHWRWLSAAAAAIAVLAALLALAPLAGLVAL